MAKRENLKTTMEAKQEGAPAASGYVIPPSRRGKVMLNVSFERAARDQLNIAAKENQTTVQAIVRDLVNEYFERIGKKPIA